MTTSNRSFNFLVNKTTLGTTEMDEGDVPVAAEGEVVLQVDRFALTANNVTYGVAGDKIGYWKFFPTRDGLGQIPVWGIGKVIASRCEGIEVNSLYYGYYPMASHLVVAPIKNTERGFNDGVAHRQELPVVYNQYTRMTETTGYKVEHYNHQVVYRPLFMTSFVLDDYFADNAFFGAEQMVLSSASSKTSFGMAFQLKSRGLKVVGLTSESNRGFVEGLGLYDQVVSYDEVETLDNTLVSAYVDMSGNRKVLSAIHYHFADNLANSCGVGITHWDAESDVDIKSLPGAKPTMFFAPTQIQKRSKEWGAQKLQEKMGEAWDKFIAVVETWVTFEESAAPESLNATYQTVLAGPAPNIAYVVKVASDS